MISDVACCSWVGIGPTPSPASDSSMKHGLAWSVEVLKLAGDCSLLAQSCTSCLHPLGRKMGEGEEGEEGVEGVGERGYGEWR